MPTRKPPATPAQLAALQKAREAQSCPQCSAWTGGGLCNECGREQERVEAIEHARAILAAPEKYLILDTETTGMDYNDEVIQSALIIPDAQGTVVMDTLIKPTCPISLGAQQVHGISIDMLQDAPTFWDIFPAFAAAITGKTLLIYNREFDEGKLRWTTARWG